MKNKKVISILVIIFITPIIVNVLMSIPTTWAKGEVGDWISFYGSYIGALLGALVAFQVARIQINAQNDLSKKLKFNEQLPTLIILKVEIEKLKKTIEDIKNYLENYAKRNNIDDYSVINIDNPIKLTIKYWDSIEKILDIDLLKKLVEFKNEYEKLSESISFNTIGIRKQIAQLSNKRNTSLLTEIEKQQLYEELNYLKNKMKAEEENKRYSWGKIMDNSIYNMLQNITNRIDKIRDKIENN